MQNPLDRLLAWHEHLIALSAAGAPLSLASDGPSSLASDGTTPRKTLANYAARLALAVGRGVPLLEAIADDEQLPAAYRSATWIAVNGNEEEALELISRPAATESKIRAATRRALMMPTILLVLALLGGFILYTYMAPPLSEIYLELETPPDGATRLLLAAPTWQGAAVVFVLLLIAALAWGGYRSRLRRGERLGLGRRKTNRVNHQAALAQRLARLIQHGASASDALRIAKDAPPRAVPERPSDRPPRDPPSNAAGASPSGLTPLITWALTRSSDSVGQAADLDFAADVYAQTAEERAQRWRRWAPAIIGGTLGGVIVLAYGLAVFVPVVRLLEALSRP